jgi:hypothetical protein
MVNRIVPTSRVRCRQEGTGQSVRPHANSGHSAKVPQATAVPKSAAMKAKVTAATLILALACLDMLRSRRSRREVPLGEPQGVRMQEPIEVHGAPAVADTFSGECPCRTTGARQRSHRSRVGSRRTAGSRIRLHDHAREDRRNRHTCRSRTLPSARPGGRRRLTLSGASR